MTGLEDETTVALGDLQRSVRAVEIHVWLRAGILDVCAVEVPSQRGAALNGDGRGADVNFQRCMIQAADGRRRVELVGRARVGGQADIRDGTSGRHQDDEGGGNISGRSLHAATDDQLQPDHDEDQRPQIAKQAQTVGRDQAGVDQECENADQDQDRRPEEAAVVARVQRVHGRARRTISHTPSAISTTGQTMSGRSQPSHPRLFSKKYTPSTTRTAGQKYSRRQYFTSRILEGSC